MLLCPCVCAAQCLYTMSEENEAITDEIKSSVVQEKLLAVTLNDKVSLYTRVVLVGECLACSTIYFTLCLIDTIVS